MSDVEGVLSIDVQVGGKPVDPFAAAVCPHRVFHQQVTVANLVDGETIVDRQVQVRILCGECGEPVRFRLDADGASGSLSTDRLTLLAVLDL